MSLFIVSLHCKTPTLLQCIYFFHITRLLLRLWRQIAWLNYSTEWRGANSSLRTTVSLPLDGVTKRVPVDPPQGRSAPGRSAPRPPQVRSFRPRFTVDPPQVLGRSAPTVRSHSRGGWWGLKHKTDIILGNIRITQYNVNISIPNP